MSTTKRCGVTRFAWFLIVAIALGAGFSTPALAQQANPTVRVMTRNMDAGTDLNYVTAALTVEELVPALFATIYEVEASRIPERITRLAEEIAEAKPDIIGLQEATLWQFKVGPDTHVYDQLELLRQALAKAGQRYELVAVQELTDIPITIPGMLDAQFTDRNAILVRHDLPPGHLDVTASETHLFEEWMPIGLPGSDTPVKAVEGWMAIDVRLHGARFTFVNTHLMAPIPGDYYEPTAGLQALQAKELLTALAKRTNLPIILVGDFNSDAELAGFGHDQTPTAGLIVQSGYTDVWHLLRPADPGFTWPLFLEDQAPGSSTLATPFERIDLIFAFGPTALTVAQTGTQTGAEGVFASDHTGVIADFALDNHRPNVPIARRR